ncbi:MAG: TetR/AcrR family transcriptional regulator [Ktedonobacteraceae bacterium]|nr:TetR/AcrR family transcriptional regulator [Ktedonobacteraceae bacterium]
MPRSEEANQRIREEQRAKILEGARKVFARKGRAATMAEVAAEAGVSQGLTYRYFASKEVLFNTLIEQMMQSGPTIMQRIREMPGTPGERLAFCVSSVVESRREQPEFYQFLYQILLDETLPNHLRELLSQQGLLFQDAMRQLIIEGQATGEVVKDDPDQLLAAIMACLEGLWRGMVLLDPEKVRKHFPEARIILRMLKPASDQE